MNCTVCGKPHSKKQPLIVTHDCEFLCPKCLTHLDTVEDYKAKGFVESENCPGLFFAIDDYAKMKPDATPAGYGGQVQLLPINPTADELEWMERQQKFYDELLTVFRIPPELLGEINHNA